MKMMITGLLLVLTVLSGHVHAQPAEGAKELSQESIVMESIIYYSKNQVWIEPAYYNAVEDFLCWAQADTTTSIVITGWTDDSGTEAFNSEFSLRRARIVKHYFVKQGIAAHRILYEGRGVDTQASSAEKARRVDMQGVIRMIVEPQSDVIAETVAAKPTEEVEQSKESEPQPVQEPITTAPDAKQPEVAIKKSSCRPFAWYAGIELGMPFGISTLSSFTPNGGTGLEGGVLGGYRFSPLLSLEAGASFGSMKLGANKCCEGYFMGVDGVRYLEHVTGMESYSYKDIFGSVSVQQYALRLNIDMLQIYNSNWQKRWSLTVSPAIYGIGTKATMKTSNRTIISHDRLFQFGAGIGIGGGYQITENLGLGLRTGMVWVLGEHYDGIAPTDHNENMIWNNTATLTWRFGGNK